jgi:hypothetical protein
LRKVNSKKRKRKKKRKEKKKEKKRKEKKRKEKKRKLICAFMNLFFKREQKLRARLFSKIKLK